MHSSPNKGSVVLATLCFIAVLAIAVTTYLTLSSRAMNLSARSFQTGLSQQLSEIGVELTMSAVNNSSWSGWTFSGAKATRTHSPAANYGQGVSASVKILLTNRYVSNWRSGTSYTVGQLAWYRGQWYQCLSATGPNVVPPPDATANWASAPSAWSSINSYTAGDIVTYNGTAYRCLLAHTSKAPPETTYWSTSGSAAWSSSTSYSVNDSVYLGGTLYKCIATNSNQSPPNITYWTGAPVIYAEGRVSLPDGSAARTTQLRVEFSPASLFPNAVGASNASTSINISSSGTVESYNSNFLQPVLWSGSTNYVAGDVVYYPATGQFYRSVTSSNVNHAPMISGSINATYWTPAISSYPAWDSAMTYQTGDLVCDSGAVYRSTRDNNNKPTSNGSWWSNQDLGYSAWSSGSSYAVGTIAFYQPPDVGGRPCSGMLYRCISAHTSNSSNRTPTRLSYWIAGNADYSTWSSTMRYNIGDIVFYPVTGLLYRCNQAHTNQAPASATVTNTSYWQHTGRYFTPWSSSTSYSPGDLTVNSGLVYRAIRAHSNSNPPNASNWVEIGTDFATWSNTAAYLVGDVVYKASNNTVYRCILAHTGQAPPNATYWSTAMQGYSAVVAAPTVTSSSTATIRGYVNANTTSFGSSATVQGPSSPSSPRIDPLRISSNPGVPQFDPPDSYSALSGSASDLPASEGNGTRLFEGARTLGTPGATAPSVYNITSTYISGSSSSATSGLYLDDSTDVLTIIGPVILNVSGILYTNSGRIVVAPTGSLEIYFNGSQLYIGNNTATTGGGILNQTFDPTKMLLTSASSYNSSSYHYFWTWQPFHGLIYMPNAYLHLWNSGFAGERYGAVSAKTVYYNHAVNLDYSMALRTAGSIGTYIEQPFAITVWRELTESADRITL